MNAPPAATITVLLRTDKQRSVLHAIAPLAHHQVYSPYGYCPDLHSALAFNGERLDLPTGHYFLGSGYRAFNAVLMRFNRPDDLSPFSSGGLNAYAYCEGEPINRSDPSGHGGFFKWFTGTPTTASRSVRTQTLPTTTAAPPLPAPPGPMPRHATGPPWKTDVLLPLPGVPTLKTLAAATMSYPRLDTHMINGRLSPSLHKELTRGLPHTMDDWILMGRMQPSIPPSERVRLTQKMIRENLDTMLAYRGQGSEMSKPQQIDLIHMPGDPSLSRDRALVWAMARFQGATLLPERIPRPRP